MTRIAVFGANGRMGKLVIQEALGEVEVIQTFDAGDMLHLDPTVEVVIDFSLPAAWDNLDTLISGKNVSLVSGTTGLADKEKNKLKQWSAEHPVFYSSNMSIGIFVLNKLLSDASEMLGDSFDKELIEFHHRRKKDSPSGTALSILNNWNEEAVYGRHGESGERQSGTIGVHAVRGGDVIGEHQLHFLGDGERLTISHTATDRRVFAIGAIRAALFITGKPIGMYNMEDLLG